MNQGYCSSGYAIAAASILSDRLCMASKKRVAISPQYIIGCDNVTNENCTKGYLHQSFKYYQDTKLLTEECMPYTLGKSLECNLKCQKSVEGGDKFTGICGLDGQEMIKREIVKNGPVGAAVQIHDDFLTYKSGIYDPDHYVYTYAGSHIVKIIGWGEENNIKYWIIENSWGEDWGEDGYARILMDSDLGISRLVLSPVISSKEDKGQDVEPETT